MNSGNNRQLAAIVFADIEGYTALMQENEQKGIEIRSQFLEALETHHNTCNGEIIRTLGDGSLSIFPNSIDAIQCCIAIQQQLRDTVPLRIGVHAGHFVRDSHDGIIGDAVNIASRIESFAAPGSVLLSDTVYDQIHNHNLFSLTSLGIYHLKNTARPYEIYAVQTEGVTLPDLEQMRGKGERKSLNAAPLPLPDMPLLGRDKEIETIKSWFDHDEKRLISITGTGGMGKTRLAIALGHELRNKFVDGVAFVGLTNTTEAGELISTINNVLEISETDAVDPIDSLTNVIGQKRVLLVLDNMEQIVAAASMVGNILDKCTKVKILVTSRIPLRISVEHEYKLNTLELPESDRPGSIEDLEACPSVALFTLRAKRSRNNFMLTNDNSADVINICSRMDGLPLALELAAARIRILNPADLLQRLNKSLDVLTKGSRDLPERHQTLRATIDWSYSLLEPTEKTLLQQLGVFVGGFSLDSVEQVCTGALILDDLESLEEKGLVQQIGDGNQRFRLLQTIREFALEKLKETGELEQMRNRHANYFLELSHLINLGTRGEDQMERMSLGIQEEPNLYEAMDWFEQESSKGDGEACEKGLMMCGELFGYWHYRGKNVLAKDRSEAFLKMPNCPEMSLGKVNAMYTVFLCQWVMGHFDQAMEISEKALNLAKKLNLPYEIVMGNMAIGLCYMATGKIVEAGKYLKISVSKAQSHGNDYQTAFSMMMFGMQNTLSGDLENGKMLLKESYAIFEQLNEYQGLGGTSAGLALISKFEGDYDKALKLYAEALPYYNILGDKAEEARVLEETAWTWLKKENTAKGREFFLKSLEAFKEVASLRGVGVALMGMAACEVIDGDYYKAALINSAARAYSEKEGILNPYSDNFVGLEYEKKLEQSLSVKELNGAREEGAQFTVEKILSLI